MKTLMNTLASSVLVLVSVTSVPAAEDEADRLTLQEAKELGREKSRFLKDDHPEAKVDTAIPKANLAHFKESIQPVLNDSCLGCHGPKRAKGGLRVDELDPNLLTGPDVETWREIYGVLSNSEMPPEDKPDYALSDAARNDFVDWLGEEMNKASAVQRGSVEHSSFRRLARYEYNYALQDLLNLPWNSHVDRLPPETASEDGFKNSSEMLQMSAMQFQTYREIGLKALRRATAIGDRPEPVTYILSMQNAMDQAMSAKNAKPFDINDEGSKNTRRSQHLLNRETGKGIQYRSGKIKPIADAVIPKSPPASPIYLEIPRNNELKLDLDRFLPDEGIMRVRLRAGRVDMQTKGDTCLELSFSAHTSNNANFKNVIGPRNVTVEASADDPELIDFYIPLGDIQRNPFRKLATTFPRRDEFLHIRNVAPGGNVSLRIDYVEITAPFYEQWPPKSHTDIFFDSKHKDDELRYGREVLSRFTRRAWRRPVGSDEIEPLMALFTGYRPEFETFEEAMLEVLATVLAHPEFLYLAHRGGAAEDGPTRISDHAFASRLSMFLWSTIPDEQLLQLADQGKLRDSKTLDTQIKRMLADPRAKRFSEHFVKQWLGLDGLDSVDHIKEDTLKYAMQNEPIAFFEDVLGNNHSVMDFIHSDYALVNERLARHYGIRDVYGIGFRRVDIDLNRERGGLLTNAAVLAMNSDGMNSNPLKRGIWMLERVLHDPPPPPPPDVPEVDLTDPRILEMTVKERLADHRNKPACSSCHARIDPWGIAFEEYDSLGSYRTHVNRKPVDATANLSDKQRLEGMDGLKRYLLMDRQDQFARAMVHKLTSYALGRSLSFGDHAQLESMTAQFRQRGDRLGDLVHLIINSELFNSN